MGKAMSERDFAITSKAWCYGIAAATVVVCGVFLALSVYRGFPTTFPFWAGIFVAISVIVIAETLIVIPPPTE
jgi:uncharacterized membrane protein